MKRLLLWVLLTGSTQLFAQNESKNDLASGAKAGNSQNKPLLAGYSSIPKVDKVYFINGPVKEGKVVNIGNEQIQFVHQGETLRYEFKKTEIERIEFASGRTEVLNEKKKDVMSTPLVVKRNRVAVLPISYIADASDSKMEEMRFRLQEIVTNFMSQSAAELKFQDPVHINAQLLKSGINEDNIRQYTAKELADILQVEYIIMGNVMQEIGDLVTVSNSYNTSRHSREYKKDEYKSRQRNNSSRVTSTSQQVETAVSVSIYNEAGERIYAKSRNSILSDQDAYKPALHYLLKRTPLYNR